jgi:murein DD-endopeptidase MepM/ murein hydrolase activator NlpD
MFLCLAYKADGQYCKPIDSYPNTGGYLGFEGQADPTHNGADFKAPVGVNVCAMLDGEVIRSGEHGGFGSLNPPTSGGVIIIRHKDKNGNYFYAVYGHLNRLIKDNYTGQPGEFVSQGQIIGTIRSFYNGDNFWPHIHLGIYVGSNFPTVGWGYSSDHTYWRDPKPWLDNNCGTMVSCNQNLTLSSPANNAEFTKGNNLSFSWSSVANASFYEIWIDNSSGFGNPEIGFNNGGSSNWVNNGIVSTNIFSLTTSMQNLLPQNLYYWRVRALDASQKPLTNWSDERIFTLLDTAPNPPNLLSPADNVENTKGNILPFVWSAVANASFFEIWIDNSSGFGSPEIGFNNGKSSNWVYNGIGSSNSFTLTTAMQNLLPQNLYYWKVRALDGNKNPLTEFSVVRSFSLLDQNNKTIINDELNGSTLGNATGITYVATPNGQGAVFSRTTEGRIEYPFSKGLPHEGTIEMLIKVTKGYSYDNYSLLDDQQSAFIFNTGPSDVWYLGAMWLVVNKNGDVSLSTALTTTPTAHTLSASNTTFRFNEWHIVSFSYGNQGQYLKVDGQLVASNPNYTETLQACGDWGNKRCEPTIGEIKSVFWGNNRYDQGFEGVLDRFRASSTQIDWLYSANTTKLIEIPEDNNQIKLYPNPVSDKLIIETVGSTRNSTIDIINSIGQVIYSDKLSETTFINTKSFSNGIYIVKLNIDNKIVFKKIIKK